jgi:type I protein arginine methyltransferase
MSVEEDVSSEDFEDEDVDWNEWEDDSDVTFVCLFCEERHPSKKETLRHCGDTHGFDFNLISQQWGMSIKQQQNKHDKQTNT